MNATLIQFNKTVLCPMESNRSIFRSEYRERCFIYQSFGMSEAAFGDMMIRPHVSFLADSGEGTAAEWEPQYGPIQLWAECGEDYTGTSVSGHDVKARKHWHFDYIEDHCLNWSQLAVDREDLKGMLAQGNLDGVFNVLMRWANH